MVKNSVVSSGNGGSMCLIVTSTFGTVPFREYLHTSPTTCCRGGGARAVVTLAAGAAAAAPAPVAVMRDLHVDLNKNQAAHNQQRTRT